MARDQGTVPPRGSLHSDPSLPRERAMPRRKKGSSRDAASVGKGRKQASVLTFFGKKAAEPKLTRQALKRQQELEEAIAVSEPAAAADSSCHVAGVPVPQSPSIPEYVPSSPSFDEIPETPSVPGEVPSSPSVPGEEGVYGGESCKELGGDANRDVPMVETEACEEIIVAPGLETNGRFALCKGAVSVDIAPQSATFDLRVCTLHGGVDVRGEGIAHDKREDVLSPVTPETAKDAAVDALARKRDVLRCANFGESSASGDQLPSAPGTTTERKQFSVAVGIQLVKPDSEPTSRLSMARNRARRQATLRRVHCEPEAIQIELEDDGKGDPAHNIKEDSDDVIMIEKASTASVGEMSKKRGRSALPTEPDKAKPLHPFFKTTTSAIVNAKDRPKRPRIPHNVKDPWEYEGSTLHVNFAAPMQPFTSAPSQRHPTSVPAVSLPTAMPLHPSFCYYPSLSKEDVELGGSGDTALRERRVVTMKENLDDTTWAERYKRDRQLDAISGVATKELIDWLQEWYKPPASDQNASGDDSSEDDDYDEVGTSRIPYESIAVITGDVGCGKSTVVSNAARQLGLSVLEINASVCRTGRHVRDVVKEAIRTHRISDKGSRFLHGTALSKLLDDGNSSVPFAKTLILFEEVDELHDDEKGFWSSVHELASSRDCRRPIICTANAFSSQMRQFFVEPRDFVSADMERIVTQTKPELPANPLSFKLIKFPNRSERQASAVLNRVVKSESVSMSADVTEFLAIACKNDSRKAINLMQFWGAFGLSASNDGSPCPSPCSSLGSPEVRGGSRRKGQHNLEVGVEVVMSTVCEEPGPTMFHVGSNNYCSRLASQRSDAADGGLDGSSDKDSQALDTWCASLEVLSCADNIRTLANVQAVTRGARSCESLDEPCFDQEVEAAIDVSAELNMQSLKYCRPYLSYRKFGKGLRDVTAETSKEFALLDCFASPFPQPRRPVLSEYIPSLRSMAVAEEKVGKEHGSRDGSAVKMVRRTRSRARKGGFCALDLNPTTVSHLKTTALEQ